MRDPALPILMNLTPRLYPSQYMVCSMILNGETRPDKTGHRYELNNTSLKQHELGLNRDPTLLEEHRGQCPTLHQTSVPPHEFVTGAKDGLLHVSMARRLPMIPPLFYF